jgi:hypothetical protein
MSAYSSLQTKSSRLDHKFGVWTQFYVAKSSKVGSQVLQTCAVLLLSSKMPNTFLRIEGKGL